MEAEQNIGVGSIEQTDPQPRAEVLEMVTDHTGRRHVVPVYDADKAYREAEALRPETPWTYWNSTMRGGREWTE